MDTYEVLQNQYAKIENLQQQIDDLEKHMRGQRRRNRWLKRELRNRNEQISILNIQLEAWKRIANRPYMTNSLLRALRTVVDKLEAYSNIDNEKLISDTRKTIKWVEESK